jgi:hypothetical protein
VKVVVVSDSVATVKIAGRLVLLGVPPSVLGKLPVVYSREPTLRLMPVYFNQGIDIVQSLATGKHAAERKIQSVVVSAFQGSAKADRSDGSSNGEDPPVSNNKAQYEINLKGLKQLNEFCRKAYPIAGGDEDEVDVSPTSPIHPMLLQLSQFVMNTKTSVKVM